MIKSILSIEYPILAFAAMIILIVMIFKLVNIQEVKSGYKLFISYYFLLYFLIGFAFAFMFYVLKDDFQPKLELFNSIYFSFVTLSTTGYGDIHPKWDAYIAQSVIIIENAVGHFLTVFIAAYIIVKKVEN